MAPRKKSEPQGTTRAKSRRKNTETPTAQEARQNARLNAAIDLRGFTEDFFIQYEASVAPLELDSAHGPLHVDMTQPLAEHFGANEMTLAFQNVEAGSGQQLVAHGSRVFDKMLTWLDRSGAMTVRRLPIRHAGSEMLLQAVRPRNAGIAGLKLHDGREPLYLFYWRITYRADDKREEVYVVALDAAGAVVASGIVEGKGKGRGESAKQLRWLRRALDASESVVAEQNYAEGGDEVDSPTENTPPLNGPPLNGPPAVDPKTPPAVKLPPVTQLVRMAEQARKYATWHADTRCVKYEADILPRLYKVANRLATYYEQQIEELSSTADAAGRELALAEDLARKIAEEVENHRLRVQVALCGYVLLYTPVASADLTLRDGKREASLRVRYDRFSGVLTKPNCHSCARALTDVVLCRNGHLACDDCLRQCATCNDVLCAECGTLPCPACGKQSCDQCGVECRACGERACADHLSRCPTCGDEVCFNCQSECAECGVRQCRSHLRAESVIALGESEGDVRLVCSECAVRCAGCRQYSARNGVCMVSGQQFCRNCLVTCYKCKKTVGPGFYGKMKSGRIVCSECTRLCATCSRPSEKVAFCATCGAECCEGCKGLCDVCGKDFCEKHFVKAVGCEHVLCADHALRCHVGGEVVCPKCNVSCAICERPFCAHHTRPCLLCGKFYCTACMTEGVCDTCGAFTTDAPYVNLLEEPCAVLPDVQELGKSGKWRKSTNRDITLYFRREQGETTLITLRKKSTGGSYVTSRRLTWIDLDHFASYRRAKTGK